MNNNKISIIVPVYNVDKYLGECIESIINQTYNNIELILVNDGSEDKSKEICFKYMKNDSRIKYFFQKNKGVSSARNLGIEHSLGKYILFVDADDYLEKNALLVMLKNINDLDLLCFGYNEVYLNKTVSVNLEKKLNNLTEIETKILSDNKIGGFLWNKLFLTKIIKKNNLKFNEKIHFCEDLLFVTEYIKHCKKMRYVNICLYNYRMRMSSASGHYYNKKNTSILLAYEIILKNQSSKKIKEDLQYQYLLNYYKLKDFIDFKINEEILDNEKSIISTRIKSEKAKFFIIKYFRKSYIFLKKVKDLNKKLFK